MKKLLAVPLIAFATTASADQIDRVKVYDHTKTIYQESPVVQTRCDEVKVPIYQQVQTQGDAAGGALAGMIIGGILGKGVTGKDDGAAAGAIIGGLVGADKGSKPKTTNQIIGYELRTECNDYTSYQTIEKEVYSHSTIRFYLNGKRYVVPFQK